MRELISVMVLMILTRFGALDNAERSNSVDALETRPGGENKCLHTGSYRHTENTFLVRALSHPLVYTCTHRDAHKYMPQPPTRICKER